MDPITILQLCVIFAIIGVSLYILKWIMDRYEKCGKTDPLCYITGEKTSYTSIVTAPFGF
jgi:hypothetical protein